MVEMVDRLFLAVLNMSLIGAFVIATICVVRLFLRKAPKVISYCLWAIAGVRLLFPFSIESVWSFIIPFSSQSIPINSATPTIPTNSAISIDIANPINQTIPQHMPSNESAASSTGYITHFGENIATETSVVYLTDITNATITVTPAINNITSISNQEITAAIVTASPNWFTVGAFVWFVGAFILFLFGMISYFILKSKMCDSSHLQTNIYEARNIKSPFVLGFLVPKIYLPIGLSSQERVCVILHEQIHVRRYDHIIKFVAYFILCLHWFNPLVWLAFMLMGMDMEMSCDESVLREMGIEETKKKYSLSLVALATERHIISSSPISFGESGIKGRVKNVLNFKKRSKLASIFAILFAAGVGIGLMIGQVEARVDTDVDNTVDAYESTITEANETATTETTTGTMRNLPEERALTIRLWNLPPPSSNNVLTLMGNFEFDIPHIAPGEIILLGQTYLPARQFYDITIDVGEGSGFFIGMTNSPDIDSIRGTTWNTYAESSDERITVPFEHSGFGFLYIGSSAEMNEQATDLFDVSGRFFLNSVPIVADPNMIIDIAMPDPSPSIPAIVGSERATERLVDIAEQFSYSGDLELFYITSDFSFEIPTVAPGRAKFVARVELEPGVILNQEIFAEGNMNNLGIGFNIHQLVDNFISQGSQVNQGTWLHWSINSRDLQFTSDENVTVYVYIISGSTMEEHGRLTNVTGRFYTTNADLNDTSDRLIRISPVVGTSVVREHHSFTPWYFDMNSDMAESITIYGVDREYWQSMTEARMTGQTTTNGVEYVSTWSISARQTGWSPWYEIIIPLP